MIQLYCIFSCIPHQYNCSINIRKFYFIQASKPIYKTVVVEYMTIIIIKWNMKILKHGWWYCFMIYWVFLRMYCIIDHKSFKRQHSRRSSRSRSNSHVLEVASLKSMILIDKTMNALKTPYLNSIIQKMILLGEPTRDIAT